MCFSSPDRGLDTLNAAFHRPPPRLHRRLMGLCMFSCYRVSRHKLRLLISSAGQERSESTVWEDLFPPLPSNCVSWIGHTGWVCKGGCLYGCIWLHAGLGPWPDGKERQEARIFCKVRDSAFVPSSFNFGIFFFLLSKIPFIVQQLRLLSAFLCSYDELTQS